MDTYGFILLILKSSQKYYKVSMVTTHVNTYIEQRLPVEKREIWEWRQWIVKSDKFCF